MLRKEHLNRGMQKRLTIVKILHIQKPRVKKGTDKQNKYLKFEEFPYRIY